ncbi:MAG: glycosyltransferase family 4 protein [Cellulosilyticaceae bacterium]
MNIGIFTDTYSPQINGVVSSIVTLEKELIKQGHNVSIFTISHPQAVNDPSYVYRLPSMPFVFLKDHRVGILYSVKTVRKIKKLKLDIILSQTEFSLGLFAKILSSRLHLPMVHTYHTMYEEYMHYVSKGVELSPELARKYSKKFCNSVTGVVAPTAKTEKLLRSYGVTTPIAVIPTGIDFTPFRSTSYAPDEITGLKNTFNLSSDTPTVLFIGRIAKEKSIDVLIQAMPLVLDKIPTAKLVIVGDGPARKELTHLTHDLGIEESVVFTGMQPWNTIGKFYQLGDVFVSASVSETQGLTFAEAMAASLPVVAKRDESVQGLIKDDYNGKLFETYEELAKILIQILSDKDYCNTLSLNAPESVEALSAETFGKNAAKYYTEMISFYKDEQQQKKLKKETKKENKKRK